MKMDASEQSDLEAGSVKLNTTEFVLLFIGEGVHETHHRIIPDQWMEQNPIPD